MFQSLLILLSVVAVWSLKFPCDLDTCPSQLNSCVKAGEFCYTQSSYYEGSNVGDSTSYEYREGSNLEATQSWDAYDPCNYNYDPNAGLPTNPLRERCPICSEEETICHRGRCLALTQEEGDECCTSAINCDETLKHKYCKSGLRCSIRNIEEQITGQGLCEVHRLAREIGENCVVDVPLCGRGSCNSQTQKCEFTASDSDNFYNCDSDSDCEFGAYCKTMYETGSGIVLNQTCTAGDPTVGAPCDLSQVGNMQTAGQCGHSLVCSKTSEMGGNCIKPFSLSEGKYCSSKYECKSGLFCNQNFGVCEPIYTSDLGADCCPRGYDNGCPHVSRGSVTEEKCYIDEVRQEAYELSKLWSASNSKLHQALQDSQCQVFSPGYECFDAANPGELEPKCSTTYAGFRSYSSFATARYSVSRVLVAACVLFAMFF